MGYGPRGCKELDTTERRCLRTAEPGGTSLAETQHPPDLRASVGPCECCSHACGLMPLTSPLPHERAYAQRCPAAGGEATGRVLASADRTSRNWVSTSLDGGVWSCAHNTHVCTCVLTRVQLFCNPGDCSPPDSSVPGISQARVLEWVTISSSKKVCVFIPKPRHELGRSEVKVAQSCLTLCNPMDYTVHENSPGQNTRVDRLSLLQGIFPTQGLNPGLPPCTKILYQLSPLGSP